MGLKRKPWGYESAKDRPGLQKDIAAMSDAAKKKRRKKVEAAAGDNLKRAMKGKKSRSVEQREKTKRGATLTGLISRYIDRIADYRKKIKALQAKQKGRK